MIGAEHGAARDLAPRVVMGGVPGDHHDEGGNVFAGCAGAEGFTFVDLGVDVSPSDFAGAVRAHRPLAVLLSCRFAVCAGGARQVIEELERQGLRSAVKIVVGGPGSTPTFAGEIGADAHAADAASGIDVLRGWIDP